MSYSYWVMHDKKEERKEERKKERKKERKEGRTTKSKFSCLFFSAFE